MDKPQIITTEDGSHTIYLPDLDESYHSTHGSVQEAEVVFIGNGLLACEKREIDLLEIGFGTGLNAYLSLVEAEKNNLKINYTGIELHPVDGDIAATLNYPEATGSGFRTEFEKMHSAAWGKAEKITENFTLTKIKADFTTADFSGSYDVIYFDAFSPGKQEEMWQKELFNKLSHVARKDGIITTYSAKGSVRRALQSAGFTVERLPGPIGKREVLRGRALTK